MSLRPDSTPPRAHRVDAGEVTLAVRERGDPAAPTVLALHGYPDTQDLWDRVAERLARDHHVLTYDLRGFGASTTPPQGTRGYALPALLADLDAVLAALAPDRHVHLVGHDWGSIIAWEAVTGPDRPEIRSLTAVAGPCLAHVRQWVLDRARRGHPRALAHLAGQACRSWYILAMQLPWLPEQVWYRFGAAIGRRIAGPEAAPTIARDGARGVGLYRANLRPAAGPRPGHGRATVPVQLVVPTRDTFISARVYDDVDRWVPDLTTRRLDAGHWVPRTHPDVLAGWIAAHLARTEAR